MNSNIIEFSPTGSQPVRRARMKMSYQALSRVLRGDFFPIERCTAPNDLLITNIYSEEDAYCCWVEYHSNSLPETNLSQPLPETTPWEYEPADSWRKMIELSEKIEEMIEDAKDSDTDPFISCKEVFAMLQQIIYGE